jgi:hypothetical protein
MFSRILFGIGAIMLSSLQWGFVVKAYKKMGAPLVASLAEAGPVSLDVTGLEYVGNAYFR